MNHRPLTDFIHSTIDSIEDGLNGRMYQVKGCIKFEVAVAITKEVGGRLRFRLADASGQYNKESISRIIFEIIRKK